MKRKAPLSSKGKGLQRSGSMGSGPKPCGLKSTGFKPKAPASPYEAERKANQRAALNALKRARRAADKAGVDLSDWEDGFLDDVGERIATHGRAFGDPEKGRPGQALSILQARKLKEISAKASGETKGNAKRPAKRPRPRKGSSGTTG